jgi:hypothetical protein
MQLVLSSEQLFQGRGSVSWQEFRQANIVDEMDAVEADDKIHILLPTGACLRKDSGQMFAAPVDNPRLLADWKLKYAACWLKATIKTFNMAKTQALAQAQQNPFGFDGVPELTRLRDVAMRAKKHFDECHEEFEVQCGRGKAWKRQQEERRAEIELSNQREAAARGKVMAAIYEIELTDTPTEEDGDE